MPKENFLPLTSPDMQKEIIEKLRAVYPPLFSDEGKLNKQELETLVKNFDGSDTSKYEFRWAGKMQSKRHAFSPSKARLKPDTKRSVDFDKTENIIIEGENLEVLKLLTKSYYNQIKCIYIDPPYNTGGDFVYSDDYSEDKKAYWEQNGTFKDGIKLDTNSESDGRYHSKWLDMMQSRLLVASQLLRDDGIIFVSIDDHEVHNLRKLMDEVFGEENFRNAIFVSRVKKNIQERDEVKAFNQGVDYVLCYAKSPSALIVPAKKFQKKEERWHAFDAPGIRPTMEYELFGQKPPKGRHWMHEKNRAMTMIDSGDLRLSEKANKPQYRLAASNETNLDTNWTDLIESDSTWIKNGGKNPKLIQRLLQVINDKNAIVLDFFAGSGTTAESVLTQNQDDGGKRKFILVQLPESTNKNNEINDQSFKTISEITMERVRSVSSTLKKEGSNNDTGFKTFVLAKSIFPENNFSPDPTKTEKENLKALEDHIARAKSQLQIDIKGKENDLMFEILLKDGFALNFTEDHLKEFKDNSIVKITDGSKTALICLDSVLKPETIKALAPYKETRFICLHRAVDTTKKWELTKMFGNDLLAFV